MSERAKDGGACCCGYDCLPPELQEAALRTAAIVGAEHVKRRTVVFLRENRGRRVDRELVAGLIRRLRAFPSEAEAGTLAGLDAEIEARRSEGMAEA